MTEQRTVEQMFLDGIGGRIAEAQVVLYPDTGQLIATVDQDKATAAQFRAALELNYPGYRLGVRDGGAGFWSAYGRKL